MNYYNEFDPNAAAWLRELIAAGEIPPGHVDTRSIVDVQPSDLAGYVQCHFFAGIGGWPYALRLAGWPDDRPVWSGSCPCQPFSSAGKHAGTADERHLWPEFMRLIAACRPPAVFGEQVASAGVVGRADPRHHGSADGDPVWLDGVCADLEGAGYACGAAVLPACGVNAPHLRYRLFWCAADVSVAVARVNGAGSDAGASGGFGREPVDSRPTGLRQADGASGAGGIDPRSPVGAPAGGATLSVAESDGRNAGAEREQRGGQQRFVEANGLVGATLPLADRQQPGLEGHAGDGDDGCEPGRQRADAAGHAPPCGCAGGVAEPDIQRNRSETHSSGDGASEANRPADWPLGCGCASGPVGDAERAERRQDGEHDQLPTGRQQAAGGPGGAGDPGPWSRSIAIYCRDNKWRRVESQPQSVVDGLSAQLDALRRAGLSEVEVGQVVEAWPLTQGRTARVMLLRGYGNAIVPQVAAEFVRAFVEANP